MAVKIGPNLTRTNTFVVDVSDVLDAFAVSEVWYTKVDMSLTATPTYEVAAEGANEVDTVGNGDVPVIVSRAPVVFSPLMVHVLSIILISPSG